MSVKFKFRRLGGERKKRQPSESLLNLLNLRVCVCVRGRACVCACMRVTEVFSLTLSLLLRFPLRAADKVRTGVTEERSGGRRSEVSPPGGK